MAKEIEWTQTSVQDRFRIYHFWISHNGSDAHSKKLEILFNKAARLISEFPEMGTETDYPDIRMKMVDSNKIFFVNLADKIQIVRVCDTRQYPSD